MAFIEGYRTRVMNVVCIISASLALVSAFIGHDSAPYVYSLIGLSAIFVVALLLNNLRSISITEYFVTIATTLWIIYMCIAFGAGLGNENYLIIALVALAVFSDKKVYRPVLVVLLILISSLIGVLHRYYTPFFDNPAAVNVIFIMNVVTPLTIIAFMCWNILKDASKSQAIIEEQKRELEESNNFKDKVFSIIGHDMRAPFNSARALVDLLENDLLTREERQIVLDELRAGVDVSLQTLDNILGWASQGYYGSILNVKIKREPLDIHALVEKNIRLYNHLATQKNVRFINNVVRGATAVADLEQISFVLRNLTSNALKFSHAGKAITFNVADDIDLIIISIKDEGVGMTKAMQDSLFRIATRFSHEGTTKEKGTGLGLIFCKEFVENNNGKLWIESEPGQGTTVFISLPKV